MEVIKTTYALEGSCNACSRRTTIVYNITLKSQSFRLCEKCRQFLIILLRRAE